MSKFFPDSARSNKKKVQNPTFLIISLDNSDGSRSMESICVETNLNPLNLLSFSDFSLAVCLKNGVSYKSLGISKDMRLGYDKEFEALEEKLSSMTSVLFDSKTE